MTVFDEIHQTWVSMRILNTIFLPYDSRLCRTIKKYIATSGELVPLLKMRKMFVKNRAGNALRDMGIKKRYMFAPVFLPTGKRLLLNFQGVS